MSLKSHSETIFTRGENQHCQHTDVVSCNEAYNKAEVCTWVLKPYTNEFNMFKESDQKYIEHCHINITAYSTACKPLVLTTKLVIGCERNKTFNSINDIRSFNDETLYYLSCHNGIQNIAQNRVVHIRNESTAFVAPYKFYVDWLIESCQWQVM